MRFKIDENLPQEIADDLIKLGYEADTVSAEGLSGAEDSAVVAAAKAAGRILLTLDKGIASLHRYPINQHEGIVLFRPDSWGKRAVATFVRSRFSTLLAMDLEGTANRRRGCKNSSPLTRDVICSAQAC